MPDLTEPIDIKLPIPCDSPPRKKPRPLLSLRKNTDKEDSRCVDPSKSLESYQRGYVPKNTDVNTSWAVRNFEDWKRAYNERHPESPCPDEVLFTDNADILSHWLQKYALGTRKKNGEKYPPKTVYSELSLFRSPMGLAQVAGISRWLHFRVPRDTRGYIRDSVTCIFSSIQGHCDWLVQ